MKDTATYRLHPACNTQSNQQANPLCLHRLVEDISVMGTGTHSDIAASDQTRPIATRTTITMHVRIASPYLPELSEVGLAYISPSQCEVDHNFVYCLDASAGQHALLGPTREAATSAFAISALETVVLMSAVARKSARKRTLRKARVVSEAAGSNRSKAAPIRSPRRQRRATSAEDQTSWRSCD